MNPGKYTRDIKIIPTANLHQTTANKIFTVN
jgi:hypothetical protein